MRKPSMIDTKTGQSVMLFRNILLQGKNGIIVKAPFAH